MAPLDSLTLCFPAYDEEANVDPCVDAALRVLDALRLARGEVLIVDDGSRDGTAARVARRSAADPRVRLVQHLRNRGYGAALRTGIAAASMEWFFLSDADLQFRLDDVPRLVEYADRADFVQGYRRVRHDPATRVALGALYRSLVHARFAMPVRDPECSFRLVRTELARSLPLVSEGPLVPVELVWRAGCRGARFAEVGVDHLPRVRGTSKALSFRSVAALARDLVKVELSR